MLDRVANRFHAKANSVVYKRTREKERYIGEMTRGRREGREEPRYHVMTRL